MLIKKKLLLGIDTKLRPVYLTDKQWEKARRQLGGASCFIRTMIENYKER